MMKTLRAFLYRLPIKWKIVIWSSFILFVLFAGYNMTQYVVINHWLNNQQAASLQKTMVQLQDYFQEKKAFLDVEQIRKSQSFLEKMNESKQLIRILDTNGVPILTVSNQLPTGWVSPQASQQSLVVSVYHDDEHLLVMRSPLIGDHFRGTIEIVHNLETLDQLSNLIFIVMAAAGIGAFVLSGFGGLLLSRQLLKPIQSFTETIHNIKQKGLHERVHLPNHNDELSQLARQFNNMMDQLEASFQLQKQFVEDASHELRTPLAIMKGHLSLLRRWGKNDPEVLEISLDTALQEFARMEGIVQELLELTRAESDTPADITELVYPSRLVQQALDRFASAHPNMSFETEFTSIEAERIQVVPNQLEQVLVILLDNAVKYSSDTPLIRIEGSKQDLHMEIRVIDSGIGIPAEDVPYVFDRFYRVDKARSRERGGTGLGLAIAKRLVEHNGGQIFITSKEQQGTIVTLRFAIALP